MPQYDSLPFPRGTNVLIVGAGAAGLMCAITAAQRGRTVLVIDHANRIGRKILMSGGGRCNFTNLHTTPGHFLSENPGFCISALSRYTPEDFIRLVREHRIAYHEKKDGQLFCDNKSRDILDMLLTECQRAGVRIRTHCSPEKVSSLAQGFELRSNLGTCQCQSLVVATGGLSIPKMGATPFGYELARQYGIAVVAPRAGLVSFTLDRKLLERLSALSGSSQFVDVSCRGRSFRENLLFTHRGLSGPAMLQISSFWQSGDTLTLNLLPEMDLYEALLSKQQLRPKAELKTLLSAYMSKNTAEVLAALFFADMNYASSAINRFSRAQLKSIAEAFHCWRLRPGGTEGYRSAEVTLGGVDTRELSSKTMEAKKHKGLYFIGEVVDVTGQLGGFNFQWAWASAVAAGEFV